MIKTATGEVHEDGSPKFHFELTQDEVDAGLSVAFATGPVSGSVALRDGAVYDITDFWIAVRPEHAGPIAHHIHRLHNALGTPGVPEHACSEECGFEQG